jgi:SAM-dependent methyltransferase
VPLTEAAELWGGADYQRIAERFAPVHDGLIEALAPGPGEAFLDVATGTGEVALRAARAGARVSGLDLAPALVEQARAKAAGEGLDVDWAEGDAQALPYEDGAFDVVASSFGVIFAPDAEAAAGELGRVCRAGGRLGLTTWKPNEGLHQIYARYAGADDGGDPAERWGDERPVRELLGERFELRFEERVWKLEGDSPETVWELMTSAAPPLKALVASLERERLDAFRAAMLEHWAGCEQDGRVVEPRGYLLVLGRRN